ncbi:hypothetical protein FVER14953_21403 [Fusarium verticillioides]|nr:hypothetical protein FVER14953_21403 [Fusarium verticillioides]
MFLRPRTLRVLRGVSQQHVRAFGFSSSSGNSPMSPMGNIPMPYIEESSAAGRKTCSFELVLQMVQEADGL